MLTHERLLHLMTYDPETGEFHWIKSPKGVKPGKGQAGCVKRMKGGPQYREIRIDRQLFYAHRLAHFYMTGAWPTNEMDHIDHDGTNNRWDNLRPASRQQNVHNRRAPTGKRSNHTGLKGVFFDKRRKAKPFYSQIWSGEKSHFLGSYATVEEARDAYIEANSRLHGSFGCP